LDLGKIRASIFFEKITLADPTIALVSVVDIKETEQAKDFRGLVVIVLVEK